jgi:hypothetical protein
MLARLGRLARLARLARLGRLGGLGGLGRLTMLTMLAMLSMLGMLGRLGMLGVLSMLSMLGGRERSTRAEACGAMPRMSDAPRNVFEEALRLPLEQRADLAAAGLPYAVVYLELEDEICVVATARGSRAPGSGATGCRSARATSG